MINTSDEVSWNEIWEQWTHIGYYYTSLNRKQESNDIIIPRENCPPGTIVRGIDWIESNDYEERIDNVVNHTISFLVSGKSMNKGTLTTAKNLVNAADDQELTAGIWVYATTFDFLESLPENWRGDPYRILRRIYNAAHFYIKDKIEFKWHHAMRSLVPNVFFSYSFLADYTPTSLMSILEVIAINALLITSNYKIVYYKTAGSEFR